MSLCLALDLISLLVWFESSRHGLFWEERDKLNKELSAIYRIASYLIKGRGIQLKIRVERPFL
jgi:hypothetical protein